MSNTHDDQSAILLVHCRDQRGLISAVTEFLSRHGGNIIDLDQHVDAIRGIFFMRVEWHLDRFALPRHEIGDAFAAEIAGPFDMHWRLHFSDDRPRMAILCSRLSHCLFDLLARCQSAEWNVDVPVIISNHPDLRSVAERFNIPFEHVPVSAGNKPEAEQRQLELLEHHAVDLVVLARYMQILSPTFIGHYPERIINIHHSFLPAFAGARPYHAAHERGVKVIGATSHYVTPELDAGPIIEQDVARVTHKDSVQDLVRQGRDLETVVLSRAVWKHLQRKVLCYDNRTVVFG